MRRPVDRGREGHARRSGAEGPGGEGLSLPGSAEVEVRLLAAKLEAFLDQETDSLGELLETQELMLRRVNDNRAMLMEILRRLETAGTDPAWPSGGADARREQERVSGSPVALGQGFSAPGTGGPGGLSGLSESRVGDYDLLVARTRALVEAVTPVGCTVLVVSRGDDELLRLGGRRARHFPSSSSGQYAGHHPADDEQAIAHLTELRGEGADYLVLPRTAFWWLDYYPRFRAHLEANYEVVVRDEAACVALSLASSGGDRPSAQEARR